MTFDDARKQIFEREPRVTNSGSMGWGIVGLALNEALYRIFPHALKARSDFYSKTLAFSSTASLVVPADLYSPLQITVAGASRGGARLLGHREFQVTKRNSVSTGTTTDPIARMNAATIDIYPAVAGVLWYIWSFPYITDGTTELTDTVVAAANSTKAIIPVMYEDSFMADAVRILRMRYLELPSFGEGEQGLRNFAEVQDALARQMQPGSVYRQQTEQPA